ncbi:TonB-dependent receptor [Butyricimonas sp. NSJ-56]|uniref:TonB-dependent receptor n=2 Tax=Butyricimonas hominis TaxID=2763032 RepID=A0ABR7CWI3_9BACT|nr:TonB-dependent receptor [Butyricimonas hominis]
MVACMARWFIILFTLISFSLDAQTLVMGKVIANSGEPVSGVNIYCMENKNGTTTDSLGFFQLECTIPCTLEFSHVNYKSETYKLTKSDAPFVVTLRNKQNNLKEVVVRAVPASGRILSSIKNIERIPAILGEQDVLKYLATMPGIVTTNALNSGIYVRGGNSNENGFLINNMVIAYPDHLTGVLSTFDPYILGNSTLFKSGFPARYNSFLSSYINMRPDPGNKYKHEGEVTIGLVSSALKAKGPIVKNHTSFAVSARTSYLQHISKLYNRSMDNEQNPNYMPEYSFSDITASIDSRLSDKWKASAFGLFSIDHMKMKISEHVQYIFDWHTFSGNINASYTPNSKEQWDFQFGGKNTYSEGDAFGSIPMGGGNRHYALLGQISYNRKLSDKININTGSKFEYSRFETANKSNERENLLIKSSDRDFNLYEIYMDINYRLNHNFTLNIGGNYQYYHGDTRAHTFSPRAKICYTNNKTTLWADYAKTVQYLSLYPYFTVKTPIDIWYPLAKNTKPAICHQYSIGVNQEIGQTLSFYAGLFYKDMRNVKDFASDIQTEYSALTDNLIQGKGHAKGMEFDLTLNHHALYARANYTLSESKRKFAEINNGRSFFPPYDVKHNVVLNLSYEISPRFLLNTLWTFSSGVYTTFPKGMVVAQNITEIQTGENPVLIPVYTDRYNYKLPDNHRLDASLDYKFSGKKTFYKLSIGAYNVYNQSNPSFVYFQAETTRNLTKIIPKSKVMLPFIPYLSLRINW